MNLLQLSRVCNDLVSSAPVERPFIVQISTGTNAPPSPFLTLFLRSPVARPFPVLDHGDITGPFLSRDCAADGDRLQGNALRECGTFQVLVHPQSVEEPAAFQEPVRPGQVFRRLSVFITNPNTIKKTFQQRQLKRFLQM